VNDKPRRRTFTAGQFIAHPRAMVESPAMRALSLAARKALDRIEIEHMNHGGAQNGQLPVTYRDFEAWGIRRHSIAAAIRELEALGFIEITRRGYGGSAELRTPSQYRLTYRPAWNAGRKDGDGTHEYLKIKTDEQAEAIAAAARKNANRRNVERSKNYFATPRIVQFPPPKTWGENAFSRPPKRGVQAHPPNRGVLSRVSGGGPDLSVCAPSPDRQRDKLIPGPTPSKTTDENG
jgi:hypothetical protein